MLVTVYIKYSGVDSYCACANARVLSLSAEKCSDLRREGGVSQITEMYQRHKLLKRLTLTFLLISIGLWTIRIVKIYWNPCKNHEAMRKIAEIFNGPAKKGVEQLGLPAAQSEYEICRNFEY